MADKFLNLNGLSYLWSKITGRLNTKQDTLVSGTNIKTINNNSLLGSGNIDVGGGDIFVVTYNETTYQEIVNAHNAGKQIVINWGGSYFSGYTLFDEFFELFSLSSSNYVDSFYLDSEDQWSRTRYLLMEKITNHTNGDILIDSYGGAEDSGVQISDVALKTDVATDNDLGLVKTNSSKSISLNANGQLEVGGRLGQFSSQAVPNGGVFYPTTIEPTEVKASSFLMSDGAKNLSLGARQFGIMAGANLTCKSASANATQYRLSNTQTNRFACFACKGGRLAIDQTDAQTNGTALITDISFANGNPISAYFGPTESSNDIIITVDRTVNPSASTTKLRIYGTSTSNDVIIVGQGCGASGGKAISLGQSCYAGGNQCIGFGNASLSLANNSVAFGHTNLVNKQFCFCAGQGHDFTNAPNGSGAVGIASEISSDTAFAVGNGVFNSNGNITRSNALEVKNDGSIVLKSPNGTKYKIAVDNSGNLTTTAIT